MNEREKEIAITQVEQVSCYQLSDLVAVEEPMEIRIVFGPPERRRSKSLSITMRTPGNDFELAIGFLFTEGIIRSQNEIQGIEHCGPTVAGRQQPNIVRVDLDERIAIDMQKLQRHFYTTSSCGVCGKASLAALNQLQLTNIDSTWQLSRQAVFELPERLRQEQRLFKSTGGIHAAGLFDRQANLICLREDVGRHNALDKLIGQLLMSDGLRRQDAILVVSGRASFELLQKALTASIPIFVAVGAPSSLAVELAEQFGLTLIGFTSANRFNVYSHPLRII